MIDPRSPYRFGAMMIGLSAVLHLMAPFLGGFTGLPVVMAAIGIFYFAIVWGLMAAWRWVAYLAFICMLIGGMGSISNIWSGGALPGRLFAAIAVVDYLAAFALFVVLWRSRPNSSALG